MFQGIEINRVGVFSVDVTLVGKSRARHLSSAFDPPPFPGLPSHPDGAKLELELRRNEKRKKACLVVDLHRLCLTSMAKLGARVKGKRPDEEVAHDKEAATR